MKAGLSLVQMATELERQQNTKRDFVADTRKVSFDAQMQQVTIANGGPTPVGTFGCKGHAHNQLAELLKMPVGFYKRMQENHPDLLSHTLNELLRREPSRRMMRTLDGNVRAFLSDKYRPLDNFDLAQAVLPVLMDLPEVRIESTQFTDTRFYIKAVFPRLQTEIKKGDVVQGGIVVSNSEVGEGSLQVAPLIFRLVCTNGMIANDYGQRRYHVGKRAAGDSESAFELFSDRTRELDDAALWSKVQDTVRGVLRQDVLDRLASRMRDATEQPIEGKVDDVVEVTAKRFGYNESTRDGILRHLIAGGDLSRYGLANALTRQSQDEQDYGTATKLEADGGAVIELAQAEWKRLLQEPAKSLKAAA